MTISIDGSGNLVQPGSIENDATREDGEYIETNEQSRATLHDGSVLRTRGDGSVGVERIGATVQGSMESQADITSTNCLDAATDSYGRLVAREDVTGRTMIQIGGMTLQFAAAQAAGLVTPDGEYTQAGYEVAAPNVTRMMDAQRAQQAAAEQAANPEPTETTPEFEKGVELLNEQLGPRMDSIISEFAATGDVGANTLEAISRYTDANVDDIRIVLGTLEEEAGRIAVDAGLPENMVKMFAHWSLNENRSGFKEAVLQHAYSRDPSKWADMAGKFMRSQMYQHIMANGGGDAIEWIEED